MIHVTLRQLLAKPPTLTVLYLYIAIIAFPSAPQLGPPGMRLNRLEQEVTRNYICIKRCIHPNVIHHKPNDIPAG